MAQFRATIEGNRGQVSRLGNKVSGIRSHTCGWDAGVNVNGYHLDDDSLNGIDVFDIFVTRGSNASGRDEFLATVRCDSKGRITVSQD